MNVVADVVVRAVNKRMKKQMDGSQKEVVDVTVEQVSDSGVPRIEHIMFNTEVPYVDGDKVSIACFPRVYAFKDERTGVLKSGMTWFGIV